MNLREVTLLAGLTLVGYASPLRADEASKLIKAEALLQFVQGGDVKRMIDPMTKAGMAQMDVSRLSDEQRAKLGDLQKRLSALLAERLEQARPAMVKVYLESYTEEELDGILAFYRSPAGAAFLRKMPDVMQRSMAATMTMIRGLEPEIKKMTEELMARPK